MSPPPLQPLVGWGRELPPLLYCRWGLELLMLLPHPAPLVVGPPVAFVWQGRKLQHLHSLDWQGRELPPLQPLLGRGHEPPSLQPLDGWGHEPPLSAALSLMGA